MYKGLECSSCGKRNIGLKFDMKSVMITAQTSIDGILKEDTATFYIKHAKCRNCGKILFDKEKDFLKVKKDAGAYFMNMYGHKFFTLTQIDSL